MKDSKQCAVNGALSST
jgi:hypothetical protein